MVNTFSPALLSAILLVATIDHGYKVFYFPSAINTALATLYLVGFAAAIRLWWKSGREPKIK